jgi:membrane protein required for colicin V production
MGLWNWLDWTLAGIVFVSVITAANQGFVRELISLAALVAGVVVAALGYTRASLWFEDLTKSHALALGMGFLVLFVGVLVLGGLVSKLAQHLVKAAGLRSIDRLLGALFGLVRGVLVTCILLLAMVAFTIKPEAVSQSTLAPYVMVGARVLAYGMPKDLKAEFQLGFGRLRQAFVQGAKRTTKN